MWQEVVKVDISDEMLDQILLTAAVAVVGAAVGLVANYFDRELAYQQEEEHERRRKQAVHLPTDA